MKEFLIDELEFNIIKFCHCITYDMEVYNLLHDAKVKDGDIIRFINEEKDSYYDISVYHIEYGDGTIWII